VPREASPPFDSAAQLSSPAHVLAAPGPDITHGTPAGAASPLPPVGLAVVDTMARWCAIFATGTLQSGQRVALVAPGSPAAVRSRPARIVGRRTEPCGTAFAQPQFADSAAYDLAIVEAEGVGTTELPAVMIAVASDVSWMRGGDGVARTDVDGDGLPEEARVCQGGEGQHFTLWRGTSSAGARRLWWRGYFDWGAEVEPTCPPGEVPGSPGGEAAP
jgi:hypothetical protein